MGWVEINPRFQERLSRKKLVSAAEFLRWPGTILCGHPDRHVLKIEVHDENSVLRGYLKKEHRVPWRDRLANAWAGFGFVSKSMREAQTLQAVAQAGIACPEVLAHGAVGSEAFLLTREEPGLTDLRVYLQRHPERSRAVARALGKALARMHAAGFEHGDLYAKHVLVGQGPRFCFLDWQRARRRNRLTWGCRCRDLASLDATLPESLANDRDRLVCVRSYLRSWAGPFCKTVVMNVRRLSGELQQKPRIREMRRVPLPKGAQDLVWLDGEALCLTQAFREEMGGQVPDWLRFRVPQRSGVEMSQVPLAGGRAGRLIRRTVTGLGGWLLSWLSKAPPPEVQQAALLFRLERHGISTPRLLGFGQRRSRLWIRHSFLLTELPRSDGSLESLLAQLSSPSRRARLLRGAGALLRQLHEAGYVLGKRAAAFASTCVVQDTSIALMSVDGLERKKQPWPALAALDLPKIRSGSRLSKTETLRFFLGYLGEPRLSPARRDLAGKTLGPIRKAAAR
jgi:tRNA A-37 threonylcarbamoyl transferase component Bud32